MDLSAEIKIKMGWQKAAKPNKSNTNTGNKVNKRTGTLINCNTGKTNSHKKLLTEP